MKGLTRDVVRTWSPPLLCSLEHSGCFLPVWFPLVESISCRFAELPDAKVYLRMTVFLSSMRRNCCRPHWGNGKLQLSSSHPVEGSERKRGKQWEEGYFYGLGTVPNLTGQRELMVQSVGRLGSWSHWLCSSTQQYTTTCNKILLESHNEWCPRLLT